MLLAKFDKHSRIARSESPVLGQIWQANDRACLNYVPKPYPGTVTDFRPPKAVSGAQRARREMGSVGGRWARDCCSACLSRRHAGRALRQALGPCPKEIYRQRD